MRNRVILTAMLCAVCANAQLMGTIRVDVQGTATNASAISGEALNQATNIAKAVVAPWTNGATAHVAATNNPHGVTAAQVGALPLAGGTMTGSINMALSDVTHLNGLWFGNATIDDTVWGISAGAFYGPSQFNLRTGFVLGADANGGGQSIANLNSVTALDFIGGGFSGNGTGLTDIPQAGVTGLIDALASKIGIASGSVATNLWAGPAASQSVTNANTIYFTW